MSTDKSGTKFELPFEDHEAFRDKVSTIDDKGKRIWLYPKKPNGRFYNARTIVSWVFLLAFLISPFIKINGEQWLLFNVIERHFVVFGIVFTPQDFHLFVLTMLTFLVFIILFTVVYGRLFCGWVCPQTIFMEMFFRKIEYLIDGDWNEQKKLEKAPWTASKIRKRVLKHAIFYAIAFVVANYFLAYIIGMDKVLQIIQEPVSKHLIGFGALLVFSFAFYGVFARLREQVCTTICPYGRLQSVLLVKESIVVAYDPIRGEPRGKLSKNANVNSTNPLQSIQNNVSLPLTQQTIKMGDCIDCKLCVNVCPTGIDIRNGTQLECVNCTACIDACDAVMDKIERPRGLIRYDSQTGIDTGVRNIFTPRLIAYSMVLVALLSVDSYFLVNRNLVESIILRAPGQLYQEVDKAHISNLYTYVLINKTSKPMPVKFSSSFKTAEIKFIGDPPNVIPANQRIEGAMFIILPLNEVESRKTKVEIFVNEKENNKTLDRVSTNFMGPGPR